MNAVLIRSNGLTVTFQCASELEFAAKAATEVEEARAHSAHGIQPIVRFFLSHGESLTEYSFDEVSGSLQERA